MATLQFSEILFSNCEVHMEICFWFLYSTVCSVFIYNIYLGRAIFCHNSTFVLILINIFMYSDYIIKQLIAGGFTNLNWEGSVGNDEFLIPSSWITSNYPEINPYSVSADI